MPKTAPIAGLFCRKPLDDAAVAEGVVEEVESSRGAVSVLVDVCPSVFVCVKTGAGVGVTSACEETWDEELLLVEAAVGVLTVEDADVELAFELVEDALVVDEGEVVELELDEVGEEEEEGLLSPSKSRYACIAFKKHTSSSSPLLTYRM